MSNEYQSKHEFFSSEDINGEGLWKYVQALSPEAIAQLSKPQSSEVFGVMEKNIVGLLGSLPSEEFNVNIVSSREHLGRLLASAMMSGYFLRNAEQRLGFEKSLQAVETVTPDEE
ncbi:MAG: DUF760 domain-containing protein [Spirulinaceae cyanobacterium]